MSYKVLCKHCDRYLFEAVNTTIVSGVICPNTKCKAKVNIKVIYPTATLEQINYKFTKAEQPPKIKEIKT